MQAHANIKDLVHHLTASLEGFTVLYLLFFDYNSLKVDALGFNISLKKMKQNNNGESELKLPE